MPLFGGGQGQGKPEEAKGTGKPRAGTRPVPLTETAFVTRILQTGSGALPVGCLQTLTP